MVEILKQGKWKRRIIDRTTKSTSFQGDRILIKEEKRKKKQENENKETQNKKNKRQERQKTKKCRYINEEKMVNQKYDRKNNMNIFKKHLRNRKNEKNRQYREVIEKKCLNVKENNMVKERKQTEKKIKWRKTEEE